MSELYYEPAYRLLERLRMREISSVELLEVLRSRVAQVNPAINAIVASDFDAARARAQAADDTLSRGGEAGSLHGLPMTVKDTLEVAGMPTVAGAPELKNHVPAGHAAAVQRVINAGATVFGKTNVPYYASDVQTFNKVYGTTRNPWDPAHTCGGSSGGSAAALAAGLTPLEIGSDIAGSLRIPAGYCGVYSHKPSYGLIPQQGHIPGPPGTVGDADLAVLGPMARCAEDLETALKLMIGPRVPESAAWRCSLPAPRHERLADCRVHLWFEDSSCDVDGSVRDILHSTADKLAGAGCKITEGVPEGFSLQRMYDLYFNLLCAVFAGGMPDSLVRTANIVGTLAHWFGRDKANTSQGFLRGITRTHREWLRWDEGRERLRLQFESFFREIDVLLMPITPTAAPPHNQKGNIYQRHITVNGRQRPYADQFIWCAPATLAGLPATAAPVGHTADGLPVGIQIVGAYGQDLSTIAFARRLAEVVGGFTPPSVKIA